MNIPRQPPEPAAPDVPGGVAQPDTQSEHLDEALEESFPASDPVAISITAIDPAPPAPECRLPESAPR